MRDVWTIIWKEWHDVMFAGGGRSTWIRPLFVMAVAGVLLPSRAALDWIGLGPIPLEVMLYFPTLIIVTVVADAIAGERERHALETLLASRISDQSILLGKVAIIAAYGWLLGLACGLLGLAVANISSGGAWHFYPTELYIGVLVVGLTLSGLASVGGTLVSLKVSTVRQAQATLTVATVVCMGVFIAGMDWVMEKISSLNITLNQALFGAAGVLAVIDAFLLAVAVAWFQRSRLIVA